MNFDRVASIYRTLEHIVFGRALQRARVRWLYEIGAPQSVLIVGEGDGRFLCELLQLHPQLRVECLDASARMLGLARSRFEREIPEATSRAMFRHDDVRTCRLPDAEYDLIVTHFVLDCFDETDLPGIVSKLAAAATPEATWLLADFRYPEGGLGKRYARMLIPAMYAFFRVAAGLKTNRLVDPTPFLREHGFSLFREERTLGGIVKSQLWRRLL